MFTCRMGSVLRLLREGINLSVRDVAKKFHLSPSAINAWETGRNKPNKNMARIIYMLWNEWVKQDTINSLLETTDTDPNPDSSRIPKSRENSHSIDVLDFIERCHIKELAMSSLDNIINLRIAAGELLSKHLEYIPASLLSQGRYIEANDILKAIFVRDYNTARVLYLCRLSLSDFEPFKTETANNTTITGSDIKMVFRNISDAIDTLLATSVEVSIRENDILFKGYYLGKENTGIPIPSISYSYASLCFLGYESMIFFDESDKE